MCLRGWLHIQHVLCSLSMLRFRCPQSTFYNISVWLCHSNKQNLSWNAALHESCWDFGSRCWDSLSLVSLEPWIDLYKALSLTHAYSTFNFFTHCVNVVTKKRQRVAMGVWVYSSKGTYAEKTFSPEKNNTNGKTERYEDAREQKLEWNFVNQKTQTDLWNRLLPKAVTVFVNSD